jgi:pimeloyl-ACP methyl ester carboxylesterase
MKTSVVLVHGAFAESASWDGVIDALRETELSVIAAANPLRGPSSDAAAVSDLVRSLDGPVVLVAHSYGGAVITNVDPGAGEIAGLVYVDAFAPDAGESCFTLADRFPGSQLADTLTPVPHADGTTDLLIAQDRFPGVFAPDVPGDVTRRMAATQRPATQEALFEPSGARPLWRELPSWFVIGEQDLVIPPAVQRYMAQRAGARKVLELPGASHAVAVSQPRPIADLVIEAASLTAAVR